MAAEVDWLHAFYIDGVNSIDYECHPRRLTASLLSDEIATISPSVSLQFFDAATRGSYIDDNGYLIDDPRETQFHTVILDQLGISSVFAAVTLGKFSNPCHVIIGRRFDDDIRASVGEIMNVLWAAHELTDEHAQSYLVWFKTFIDTPSWKPSS